jgi:hypothetical protein
MAAVHFSDAAVDALLMDCPVDAVPKKDVFRNTILFTPILYLNNRNIRQQPMIALNYPDQHFVYENGHIV